jgi:hypothetical protein
MARTFLEDADHEGFAQGWFDGMHRQSAVPKPKLSPGMFDLEYLKRFKAAYQDGHETAREEWQRRKLLLQSKSHQKSHALERDDV